MKRFRIIWIMQAVLTTLLMVACSKLDFIPSSEKTAIMIHSVQSPMHKAVEMNQDFAVFALSSTSPSGTAWTDAISSRSDYLVNVPFGWSDGVGYAYTYADNAVAERNRNPYYWPSTGSLLFAGYFPHKDNSNGTVTNVLAPTVSSVNPYMSISFTQNTTLSEMVDLRWFDIKDINAGKSLSKQNSAVAVPFKHALTKLVFRFTDDYSHYRMSAKLLNCVNEGTFYSGNNPDWVPSSDETKLADYHLIGDESLSSTAKEATLYIIPQYLDGNFPKLGINIGEDIILEMYVTDKDGFGGQTISVALKDLVAPEASLLLERGKSYIYNVSANSQKIEVAVPMVEHRDIITEI